MTDHADPKVEIADLAAQRLASRNRAVLGLLVSFIVIVFLITLFKARH
jgi:hypothetical protein